MMFPTNSISRIWTSVFLCAAVALFFGVASTPAQAHCKGKHTGSHPHCAGTEPPANFNPELVWVNDGIVIANGDGSNPTKIYTYPNVSGGTRKLRVSWAPGGREILFAISDGPQGPGIYRLPIFVDDPDSLNPRGQYSVGTPTFVVATNDFWGMKAHWSPVPAPDGNYWIAY
ncbi:MAG: hypothetical protein O7A66_00370, partial [Alphaproteobacteria bacterium]|nr:hypothetical protein [Alphaproteobacteria bacterium]